MSTFISVSRFAATTAVALWAVVASAQDVTPPTLLDLSVDPTTVDISDASEAVFFTWHLTDDLSGLPGPPNSSPTQIRMRSPSHNQFVDSVVSSRDLVSGTLLDGIFRTTATLPRYSETGTWEPQFLLLVDTVGNLRWLYPNDLSDMGLNLAVTVAATSPSGTWIGSGGPGNARWDVGANWSDGMVPSDDDVMFGTRFTNGNTIDLAGNRTARVVTFTNTDANNLTFVSGSLSLTGISKTAGNGSVTFADSTTVNVAGGTTIDNSVPGGTITFAGKVNLQGPGVTIAGSAPVMVSGMLHDLGYGLTIAGNLAVSGTISALSGLDGSGNAALLPGGRLTAAQVRLGALSIGNGARAAIWPVVSPAPRTSTSRLGTLSIDGGPAPTGTLDLGNSSLILDYSGPLGNVLADTAAQIRSARNGKDVNDQANWDGPGITSSQARRRNSVAGIDLYNVGCINNADIGALGITPPYAAFGGLPVDETSVLVRYTYTGDANLDGKVDADDYSYWLVGFLTLHGQSDKWLWGDFDYNGVVDADDYTQWLNGFLQQRAPLDSGGPNPVPEPATLGFLSVGAVALLAYAWRWRRR